MNKDKKFIKDAFDGKLGLEMCQDWKDKILEEYPEFKETHYFKSDDYLIKEWKCDSDVDFFRLGEEIKDGVFKTSEYIRNFKVLEHNTTVNVYNAIEDDRLLLRKATAKEIEQHLIKEAKRRYNVPCKVHYLDSGINSLKGYSLVYDIENDTLGASCDGRRDFIYRKGQWAEIINTMTKEDAEAKLNCKIVD